MQNSWIEEFREKFSNSFYTFPDNKGMITMDQRSYTQDSIKAFITTLITQQRAEAKREALESVRKVKYELVSIHDNVQGLDTNPQSRGYKDGIKDAINILTTLTKEQ